MTARHQTVGALMVLWLGVCGITAFGRVGENTSPQSGRALSWEQWSAPSFELDAAGPVPAGIDGEAMILEPPLRFRVHPETLRVRVAPNHPGASPSALEPDKPWQIIPALVNIALHGHPTELAKAA